MTIDSVGDVNVTSGAPSLTITNTTHEDTDGGRKAPLSLKVNSQVANYQH